MRRPGGWLLIVVGSLLALVGIAVAWIFGPDNRAATGPHGYSSAGAAVVTAPAALAYSGPRVEVTAAAADRPVFVGVAYDVDVRDYLARTAYTQIDSIDLPWSTETSTVPGDRQVSVRPADVHFWLVSASGDGGATVVFPLPDAAVDVVVMDADGEPDLSVELTVAVVQSGAFVSGLALLAVGVGVAAGGGLLLRHAPRRARRRGRARPGRRRRPRGKPAVES